MLARGRSNGLQIDLWRPKISLQYRLQTGARDCPAGIVTIGRARRGASGALYPQPAPAGLNSLSRFFPSGLRPLRNVDGEVSLGGAL